MAIRILGGSARGRRLLGPVGYKFRPTTGRVKEFIFSYLGSRVTGARILDLFSGTGSLGIEALSRGADEAFFIERSAPTVKILKKNVGICGFSEQANVMRGDVFILLNKLGKDSEKFDLVLADPPFKGFFREEIVKTVEENRLLKDDGLLLVEHERHDPDDGGHGKEIVKQRRFGHCVVSVYR
jgi:16S rRNA (guanine(966)-N(2))-methyltransferase RsmD